MSTERDELRGVVNRADWTARAEVITDAILAAGYRKPRIITTAEELDALGEGSAVIDSDEDVSTKHDGKWHGYEMNPLDSRKFAKCGPFTVLWEPK